MNETEMESGKGKAVINYKKWSNHQCCSIDTSLDI